MSKETLDIHLEYVAAKWEEFPGGLRWYECHECKVCSELSPEFRPKLKVSHRLTMKLPETWNFSKLGITRENVSDHSSEAYAPELGIEAFGVTIFGSNVPSLQLFKSRGFQQWGFMPRVVRLGEIERDVVMMGRRLI